MDKLTKRIQDEQNKYLEWVATLPPAAIISKAYEICWRNEFIFVLENTEFDDETMETLLNTEHLLDILYDEWLSTDIHVTTMVEDVIRDFAKG